LVGAVGMIAGAMLYAFSFDWVKANILSVWKLGKVSLPQMMGISPLLLYAVLAVFALVLFRWVEKRHL